jgi:hypothetical protein
MYHQNLYICTLSFIFTSTTSESTVQGISSRSTCTWFYDRQNMRRIHVMHTSLSFALAVCFCIMIFSTFVKSQSNIDYSIDVLDTTLSMNGDVDTCKVQVSEIIQLTYANTTARTSFTIPIYNSLTEDGSYVAISSIYATSLTTTVSLYTLTISNNIQGTATLLSIEFGFNPDNSTLGNSTTARIQLSYVTLGIFRTTTNSNAVIWSVQMDKPVNFTRLTVNIPLAWSTRFTSTQVTVTPTSDISSLSSAVAVIDRQQLTSNELYVMSVSFPKQTTCQQSSGSAVVGLIVVGSIAAVVAAGILVCVGALTVHLLMQKYQKKKLLSVVPHQAHILNMRQTETVYSHAIVPESLTVNYNQTMNTGLVLREPVQIYDTSHSSPSNRYHVANFTPGADYDLRN